MCFELIYLYTLYMGKKGMGRKGKKGKGCLLYICMYVHIRSLIVINKEKGLIVVDGGGGK
jgi:hypothetical protein